MSVCEAALLCRLTCSRFVASGRGVLVTEMREGATMTYFFEDKRTKFTFKLADIWEGKPEVQERWVPHAELLRNVHPRGCDGGVVFTAALARRAMKMSAFAVLPRERGPGVGPSLGGSCSASVVSATAAAFAGLQVHSFSSSLGTALLSRCISITFSGRFVSVSTGERVRKIILPGNVRLERGGGSCSVVAEGRCNLDVLVVQVCHLVYSMV